MTQDVRPPPSAPAREGFLAGLRAALPIAIGYLPAAFAFGAAATGIGLTAAESGALSALVFSGANQVFLVAAIPAGMAPVMIVLLTGAASLRHLLYGLVLAPRIGGSLGQRLVFAFGLTDEVFATALARPVGAPRPSGAWLIGLALAAWAASFGGTVAGAIMGDALRRSSTAAAEAMSFALPALFAALVLGAARRAVLAPMLLAAGAAVALILLGQPDLAIPAGAAMALTARRRPVMVPADTELDHMP